MSFDSIADTTGSGGKTADTIRIFLKVFLSSNENGADSKLGFQFVNKAFA